MSVLAFLLLSLYFFLAAALFVAVCRRSSVSEVFVFGGLLAAAQLVMTQLLLGVAGQLAITPLLSLNLGFSTALLAWAAVARRAALLEFAGGLSGRLAAGSRDSLNPFNLGLLGLTFFILIWFGVAAWLLPPRGIDDLVAHLPQIYQYVQDGEISLLPLKLRDQFAMPMNGEFLFMWPLIFFHADTLVDSVQFVVALYGVVVLYAMIRSFDVSREDAAFSALLFLFTPLVLAQAGSNYVDLIVGVVYLVLLFAVVRFWQTGAFFHLLMCSVAAGFGLGVKYNFIVAAAAVQPIILLSLWRSGSLARLCVQYVIHIAVSVPFFVYWYARNYAETGYALYPYDLSLKGLAPIPWSMSINFPGNNQAADYSVRAIVDLLQAPLQFFFSLLAQDPGLGSFNGGFGVVYWALGLPAIVYCLLLAVRALRRKDLFPLLFWGHVPLAYGVLFIQFTTQRLQFNQRLTLVLAGFGLLALALVIRQIRKDYPQVITGIRSFCLVAAALSVIHVAGSVWPSYRISAPVRDLLDGTHTSDYKYFEAAAWDLPLLAAAWEPLDYLSREGPGWDVYTAAPWGLSWTTPVFGSRIQNRIWNFLQPEVGFYVDEPVGFFTGEAGENPDAFIFHRMNEAPLFYLGRKITPAMVAASGNYEIVTQTPITQFWVGADLLRDPEISRRLMAYYELAFGEQIKALRRIIPILPASDLLVTDASIGHGLRYLALSGELDMPIHFAARGRVAQHVRRIRPASVISVNGPLAGYQSKLIGRIKTRSGILTLHENQRR